MPYWKGEKWACYSCTKGHRSSKCTHYDRILYKVRKPGRPLNNCPHVLPDSIPPGTFVNTSAESMANGQPPKEVCNCKNDLVQVAIPKVKSCSCLTPESIDAMLSPSEAAEATQAGVKKGRVSKRPVPRRKRSEASKELVEAAKAEVTWADSTRLEFTQINTASTEDGRGVAIRAPCTKTGLQGSDVLVGPVGPPLNSQSVILERCVSHDDPATDENRPFGPTVSEVNGYWPTHIPSSPLVSSTAGGIDNLSLAQNSLSELPTNPIASTFNSTYSSLQNDRRNSLFMDSFPEQDKFYPRHVTPPGLTSVTQQSVTMFPAQRSYNNLNPSPDKTSGHINKHILPPALKRTTEPGGVADRNLIVGLSHCEWLLIQKIRASGTDPAVLSKIISDKKAELTFSLLYNRAPITHCSSGTDGNLSSSASSPYTNLDSTHSSPQPIPIGCCSKKVKSLPPPPTNNFVALSSNGSTSTPEMPGSPRCKCGEACRCVPCADHPHNPAMLAHIRENMQLMESPQTLYEIDHQMRIPSSLHTNSSSFNGPSLGYDAFYNEDDDGPHDGSVGDFNDFVICDYKYGSVECREGTGGCKCGEGCTCIGCLTHGGHDGHDGMLLDIPKGPQRLNHKGSEVGPTS